MDVNFKLIKPDGTEINADTINWVTWKTDGGGGIKSAHDGPLMGRSLAMDMKTIPMDVLLAMSQNNFELSPVRLNSFCALIKSRGLILVIRLFLL